MSDAPVMAGLGPAPKALIADKRHDANAILDNLEVSDAVAVVPAKRNRNFQSVIDRHRYARRMWSSGAFREDQASSKGGHPLRQGR